jgi:hypothetical protein
MPQKIVGSPINKVRLVALLTRQLTITSSPVPGCRTITATKIRFPIPVQYGMISVPNTVPSTPLPDIASNRHRINADASRKRIRRIHGSHAPARPMR